MTTNESKIHSFQCFQNLDTKFYSLLVLLPLKYATTHPTTSSFGKKTKKNVTTKKEKKSRRITKETACRQRFSSGPE